LINNYLKCLENPGISFELLLIPGIPVFQQDRPSRSKIIVYREFSLFQISSKSVNIVKPFFLTLAVKVTSCWFLYALICENIHINKILFANYFKIL